MRRGWIFALALLPFTAAQAAAQEAPRPGDIPHEVYRLDNGLRVILAQDRTLPVVAVNVWYDVGSRNERPGRSGFGHLFEHLMFQGSENVARGEHMQLVQRAGGNLNASITEDRTNYFQTLPPDRYNLGLWLESDRMRSLQITHENMRREIEVVKEERRLRIDNAPYGTSQLQVFYYAAYDSTTCFPYAHSVIGSMEDLDAAELRDVQDFFRTYYAPNNATLTLVGDFDADEARALIQQYFGGIPSGHQPEAVQCTEPFSHLPVRRTMHDGNATLPALWMSYGGLSASDPDSYALALLATILGGGESSRLHQRLVRQEQAAVQAQSFASRRRGPGLFGVIAIANQGVEASRLEALIDEEIARIHSEGVTAGELERAQNQMREQTVRGRQSAMGRAEALQWFAHFHGDPGALRTDLDRFMAVTREDVQRIARRYVVNDNRALVVTQPGTGQE
jgi:zinc protease